MNHSSTAEPTSLDEFLKTQAAARLIATVEEISAEGDKVKVTPWAPAAGCMCHAALTIPRNAIESVKATGDSHYCCGHLLRVGEIQFKAGATIELSQVFAQLSQWVGAGGANHLAPFSGAATR